MEGSTPPGQPCPFLGPVYARLPTSADVRLILSAHPIRKSPHHPTGFNVPLCPGPQRTKNSLARPRPLRAVWHAFVASVCLLTPGLSPAQNADQLPGSIGKGPIGWDSYRRLDLFPNMRSNTETRDFSSTDPAQANGDFNHPFRVTSNGQYVIAEANGPGEIVSIWSTINGGDVTNDGAITIQLDGKVVLSANYQQLVSGALGAPWVWPLVGNLYDTSGGAQIKVPMPYTKSMLVTVQGNPDYFHVIYRQFNDTTGVKTFDPTDKALDVIAKLRAFGMRDPKPALSGTTTSSADINIPANSQSQLVQLNGAGEITELRLKLPQVQHAPFVADDGRAFGSGGSSQFTTAIDPANQGVRVTRRYDPSIGDQKANVYVNGTLAGQWSSGAAVPAGPWADETIVFPASLTAGKSQITIINQFVSSDLDFNEFRYDVSCLVNGEWTRSDTVDAGPNHPGEESAHGYAIAGQTWQGFRTFSYPVDAQTVANSMAVLTGARLQISFDGRRTVDAPIGEFFGSASASTMSAR
jgi:D-arabinan exo alpha-(1,3)/(1,5)-arabinofuranosidase (non-reducing end)